MGIDTIVTGLVVLGAAWGLLNRIASIALFLFTIVVAFYR